MTAGGYVKAADLPQVIPVFPVDGALLLPRGGLPLNVFEPRYLNMIDDAMAGDRIIGMIQTRAGGERSRPSLAAVGCAGRITSYAETSDGRYLLTLTGVCRFRVVAELAAPSPYRQVRADFLLFEPDLSDGEAMSDEEREALLEALRAYLTPRGFDIDWSTAREAPLDALVNSLSMALPFEPAEKQALLEALTLEDRLDALVACSVSARQVAKTTATPRSNEQPPMTSQTNPGPARSAELDRRLLEVLVCPVTHGPLEYDRIAQELISRRAGLAYPIRDGAPIMLPEEARALDAGPEA